MKQWFHTTKCKNIQYILEKGLLINQNKHFTINWISDYYHGINPIFLSRDFYWSESEDLCHLLVNIEGIKQYPDIPALTDKGASISQDGESLYWEEYDEPKKLIPYLEDGEINIDYIFDNENIIKICIDITKTCTILQNIEPYRIRLLKK